MGLAIRYPIALLFAAAITFGLFFVMQLLIAMGSGDIERKPPMKIADINMPERELDPQRKEKKPEKPEEPEPPPEIVQPKLDFNAPTNSINMATVKVDTNVNVGGLGLGVNDGEYLPIVRPPPIYPSRALSRNIEGYVIVEYTVTASGAVRDPFVVEAFDTNNNPTTIFNSAALKAALKFKYRPRVIDGEPVEVSGVQIQITFKLPD